MKVILPFLLLFNVKQYKSLPPKLFYEVYKVEYFKSSDKQFDLNKKECLDRDITLVLGHNEKGELRFTNAHVAEGTYSTGSVENFKTSVQNFEASYPTETISFTWNFHNSYNKITGKAKVLFVKKYNAANKQFEFEATIEVMEEKYQIELKGFLKKSTRGL